MSFSGFKDLSQRVITGLALAGGFLVLDLGVYFVPTLKWALFLAAGLVSSLCAFEFATFSSAGQSMKRSIYFLNIFLVLFLSFMLLFGSAVYEPKIQGLQGMAISSISLAFGFLFSSAYLVSSGSKELEQSSGTARDLFPALILIGFSGSLLMALTLIDGAALIVLWLVLTVSINDIASYFAGSRVGGPKLAPIISPNKTVSGALAGLLAAGIIAGILGPIFGVARDPLGSFLIGTIVVIAAQLGDLLKSYLKRLHGVKDSGSILPGHGGVLDRVDGYLGAAPVLYGWLALKFFLS